MTVTCTQCGRENNPATGVQWCPGCGKATWFPWRIGRHYGIHVYQGALPIATFHTVEHAKEAVEARNEVAARAAEADPCLICGGTGKRHRVSQEAMDWASEQIAEIGSVDPADCKPFSELRKEVEARRASPAAPDSWAHKCSTCGGKGWIENDFDTDVPDRWCTDCSGTGKHSPTAPYAVVDAQHLNETEHKAIAEQLTPHFMAAEIASIRAQLAETERRYLDMDRRRLDAEAALAEKDKRIAELRAACSKEDDEIQQILGKALGYPWFKDDLKNFPDATEVQGVCVGDHVAASLAMEAARRIAELEAGLSPFAKRADNYGAHYADRDEALNLYLTVGHLRHARTLLSTTKPKEEK